MKKITVLFPSLFICFLAFSQSYMPLDISPGTYWTTHHYNCCINSSAPACLSNHYSEVVSDTIINTQLYSKIRMGYIDNNGSSNCLGTNYIKIHYLRQDTLNKKIYERLLTGNDTLIIDYSQQVGDSCNLYYLNFPKSFIVTSIDSILINSVYHRRINYGSNQFSLIEGVGTTLGITDFAFDFENKTELTCKGHTGIVQYPDTTLSPFSCNPLINLGQSNINLNNGKLFIYPSPASSKLFVELNNSLISQINLYDQVGNLVQQLNANTNKLEMDLINIPKGLYFISVKNSSNDFFNRKLVID